MKKIKFYEFYDCNTCKKALKFLTNRRYAVERFDIFTEPPSGKEIRQMIAYYNGDYRKLLSPAQKRNQDMGLTDKLPTLTEQQTIELLENDGKLFRRPFLLAEDFGLVGFDETIWDARFPK